MTRIKLRAFGVLISALGLGTGCGSDYAGGGEDGEVGEVEQALAPAGSNAQFVSADTSSPMAPGERRLFSVTMLNTGTTPGTNDWTASPAYALSSLNSSFNWWYTYVPATIPVGSTHTFAFAVTAPATSATFSARMSAVGLGVFGDVISIPITVDPGVTPQYHCTFEPTLSTVPTTMAAGETRFITVTVRNTGTATWAGTPNFKLVTRDSPPALWGQQNADNTLSVPPNGTRSFSFSIKAPTTGTSAAFRREMKDYSGIGDFRAYGPFCVDTTIAIGGQPPLDSQVVSHTLPSTMAAGEVRNVQVVMRNTGTETWQPGGSYVLYSTNNPVNLWGSTITNVTATTATNGEVTLNLNITAPSTPGTYAHSWQMRKTTTYFGEQLNVPVTVTATQAPYASTVVSQTIPSRVTAGLPYNFVITMQNTGVQPWTGTPFMIYTQNAPVGLWGTQQVTLGASETIAPTGTRTFTIPVVAPTTPGTYASNWRMRFTSIGVFGALAQTTGIVVTNCGNGVIDAGEQCDDGNLTNGDDCPDSCQFEQIVIGPNGQDRKIFGTGSNGQLAPVAIGDVTGDGVLDVLTSQLPGAPGTGTNKGSAGSIYGFTSSPFLNGTSTVVSSANFFIGGAEANDLLGVHAVNRIIVGNVTGSATSDLIASSSAAGPTNSRPLAGEIYVITGGSAALTTPSAPLTDLGLTPLPSAVGAHITGLTGDRLQALGVGNLVGGDSVPDLLVGVPGRGALIILRGPLAGEIDLTSPPAGTVTLVGVAGEGCGYRAAIGDLNNDGTADILAGCPSGAFGGLTSSGSAYAAFGPFLTDRNFALGAGSPSGPSVVWHGEEAFDGLGIGVAIGNVTGDATNEALISAHQLHKNVADPNDQYGGVTVWSNPPAGSTFNLAADPATVEIQGPDLKDNCGSAVGAAKVSGGTYDDIVFACLAADGQTNTLPAAGELHVITGRATFPAIWDVKTRGSSLVIYGAEQGANMGRSYTDLALADLDGDNFADICVGSFNGFQGSVKTGRLDCYSSPF